MLVNSNGRVAATAWNAIVGRTGQIPFRTTLDAFRVSEDVASNTSAWTFCSVWSLRPVVSADAVTVQRTLRCWIVFEAGVFRVQAPSPGIVDRRVQRLLSSAFRHAKLDWVQFHLTIVDDVCDEKVSGIAVR